MSSRQRISGSGAPKTMRTVFGIIMILVYLGMGVLFFIGFFDLLVGGWPWVKWVLGGLFVVYGIWRAYRLYAGLDPEYSQGVADRNEE